MTIVAQNRDVYVERNDSLPSYTIPFTFEEFNQVEIYWSSGSDTAGMLDWHKLTINTNYTITRNMVGGTVKILNPANLVDENGDPFARLNIKSTYPYQSITPHQTNYSQANSDSITDNEEIQIQQTTSFLNYIADLVKKELVRIISPKDKDRLVKIYLTGKNILQGCRIIDAEGSPTTVQNDALIEGNFTVNGETSLQATTATTITTSGLVKVGGTLNVVGATTLDNTLTVKGAATLETTLNVKGATTLDNTLTVAKKATCKEDLQVEGHASFVTMYSSDTAVLHDVTVTTALNVGTTAFVGGTLKVSGAVDFSSTLSVAGNTTLKGTLEVQGTSTLKDVICTTLNATTHVDTPVVKFSGYLENNATKYFWSEMPSSFTNGYALFGKPGENPGEIVFYWADATEAIGEPDFGITQNFYPIGDGAGGLKDGKWAQFDSLETIATSFSARARNVVADLDVVVGRAFNLGDVDYLLDNLEATYADKKYLQVLDVDGNRKLTWSTVTTGGGGSAVIDITKNVVPIGNFDGDGLVDSHLVYNPTKFLFQAGTSNFNVSLYSTADIIIERNLLYGGYTWVPKFDKPPAEMVGQFLTLKAHPENGKFYLSTSPGVSGSITVSENTIPMGDANGDLVDSCMKQDDTLSKVTVGTIVTPMGFETTASITSGGGITVTDEAIMNDTLLTKGIATFEKDVITKGDITLGGVEVRFNLVSATDADGKYGKFRKDPIEDIAILEAVDAPNSSDGGNSSVIINGTRVSGTNMVPGDLIQTYSMRRFENINGRMFDLYNNIEYLPCDGREVPSTVYPGLDSWIEVVNPEPSFEQMENIVMAGQASNCKCIRAVAGETYGYALLSTGATDNWGATTHSLWRFDYTTKAITKLHDLPVISNSVYYYFCFGVCEIGGYFYGSYIFGSYTSEKFFIRDLTTGSLWGTEYTLQRLSASTYGARNALHSPDGGNVLLACSCANAFDDYNFTIDIPNKTYTVAVKQNIRTGASTGYIVNMFIVNDQFVVTETYYTGTTTRYPYMKGYSCEFTGHLTLVIDSTSTIANGYHSAYPLGWPDTMGSMGVDSGNNFMILGSGTNKTLYKDLNQTIFPASTYAGAGNVDTVRVAYRNANGSPQNIYISVSPYPNEKYELAGNAYLISPTFSGTYVSNADSRVINKKGVLLGIGTSAATTSTPLFWIKLNYPEGYKLPTVHGSLIAMPYKSAVKRIATEAVDARAISDTGSLQPVTVSPSASDFFFIEASGTQIFAATRGGYIYSGEAVNNMSPAPGGQRIGLATIFNYINGTNAIYAISYTGNTIKIEVVSNTLANLVYTNSMWSAAPIDGSFGNFICLSRDDGSLAFASPTDYSFTTITPPSLISRLAAIGNYTFGITDDGKSVYRWENKGTNQTQIYNNSSLIMNNIACNDEQVFVIGSATGKGFALVLNTPTGTAVATLHSDVSTFSMNTIDCLGNDVLMSDIKGFFFQSSDGLATAPSGVSVSNGTGDSQAEVRLTSPYDFITINTGSGGNEGVLYYFISESNYNTAPRNWMKSLNRTTPENSLIFALNSVGDFIYTTLGNASVWEYYSNILKDAYTFHGYQNLIAGDEAGKFFCASDNGIIGKSLDGGKTWTEAGNVGENHAGGFIQLPNGDMYYGGNRDVYFSVDDGLVWNMVSVPTPNMNAKAFKQFNAAVTFILLNAALPNSPNQPQIVTYDGVALVVKKVGDEGEMFSSIAINSMSIAVGTDAGYIYYSSDGGETWEKTPEAVAAGDEVTDVEIEAANERIYCIIGGVVYLKFFKDLGTEGGWYIEPLRDEVFSLKIETNINVYGSSFNSVLVQEKYI